MSLRLTPYVSVGAIAPSLILVLSVGWAETAIAQVSPDGSLSTTVTSRDGLNFTIEHGERTGPNLFHSFDEFSIPTDGSASFHNATGVENIIGRVTGNRSSTIDGLLDANGDANVFLLNPKGFLFGPNAQLNIGGSFLATSAEHLLFEDGARFSASPDPSSALLTISTPSGLQMGRSPGPIAVQGQGHQVIHTLDYAPVQQASSVRGPSGLHVNSGESLTLIGAGVELDGAMLSAPGGHIELGSIEAGRVHWQQQEYQYELNTDPNTIHLSQRTLLDVSDRTSGSVNLYGSHLLFDSGATILGQHSGPDPSHPITLRGTESIVLQGTAPNGTPRTQVRTETNGAGMGGQIQVSTPFLHIKRGSALISTTFGPAEAGTIRIQDTEHVQISGFSPFALDHAASSSVLATLSVGGTGDAGSIHVNADQLHLRNGGSIASLALFGDGNGGRIAIDVPFIRLQGINPRIDFSGISSATLGHGTAGMIDINTNTLHVKDGSVIDSSSLADGDAGDISIQATERIHIDGFGAPDVNAERLLRSSINSITSTIRTPTINLPGIVNIPAGDAGQVHLKTSKLLVENHGQVSIAIEGPGNSRGIRIDADVIRLSNQGRILATTTTGASGSINLQVQRLILDNGLINASVLDTGTGGDITIQATQAIEIMGTGSDDLLASVIIPSFIGALDITELPPGIWAIAGENGTPGNITLNTQDLSLLNGSTIATATLSEYPGGSLIVHAKNAVDIQASVLSSSTFSTGDAGDIQIDTGQLRARDGGEIIATTFGAGDAGNLMINASESIFLTGQSLSEGRFASGFFPSGLLADAQNGATGNGGDVHLKTPLLSLHDGAVLSVSVEAPSIDLALLTGGPTDSSSQRLERNRVRPSLEEHPPNHPRRESSRGSVAGTIDAEIGWMVLNQGTVRATSLQGEGGNIHLAIADGLFMTHHSAISTQAGAAGGGGNGGNITISTPFIAAFNNSDIIANAFEGNGGNIQLITQGLFGLTAQEMLTINNDITASSQLGLSGTVTLPAPDVDPATASVILPSTVIASAQHIATACSATTSSRFIITGRGGIPPSLSGSVGGDRPWRDILPDFGHIPDPVSELEPTPAPPQSRNSAVMHGETSSRSPSRDVNAPKAIPFEPTRPLQEATEMAIATDGHIILVNATRPTLLTSGPTCIPPQPATHMHEAV